MQTEEILDLLHGTEGLKLDFKREFYKIDAHDPQVRNRQWNELIKDVLALANGNVGVSNQAARLIIGVSDLVNNDGSRDLFDVSHINISADQILKKVNTVCDPPLPDLHSQFVEVQAKTLLIITIPASPHLHETTKRLETSNTVYSERTVFIRRADGIRAATAAERAAILVDKRRSGQAIRSVDNESHDPLIEGALNLLLAQAKKEERDRQRYLAINELPFERVDNFTGRQKEFDELITQLQEGETCHIRSFVFGMGGIGKTSLAIQAVHHIKDTNIFPDGIIWYRVRDEELGRVVNRFSQLVFRALRKDNTLAALPIDERVEAFKREFRNLKILFVLDNADYDIDKVLRPLLHLLEPFSVLVTSRQELPLPSSAHIITLGALSKDEAGTLFKKILADRWQTYGSEYEVEEICTVVGFLPLAVKLAAFYIKQNRCSFEEYLSLWRGSRTRLRLLSAETLDVEISRRNVSACFNISFEELSEKEKELFLWLGLFQSDFDLRALRATLGDGFFSDGSLDEAHRMMTLKESLNRLASLSLVDKLDGFGERMRIHLHPLLSEFAIEKRGSDVDSDRQRIFDHYLSLLTDDVSVVGTDYVHVKNAVTWKFNLAKHQEFIDFADEMKGALWKAALWKFLGELLNLALKAAQFLDNKPASARLIGDLGDLQHRKGDDEGLVLIRAAIEIYESLPDIPEGELSHYLFLKYRLISEGATINERVIRICESLQLFVRYGKGTLAHLIGAFASVYSHLGDYERAYELHRAEAEYWEKANETYNLTLSELLASGCQTRSTVNHLLALEQAVERGLKRAEEHRNIAALAQLILPDQIQLLIYRNKNHESYAILMELEKYAQIMDSESLLIRCYYLKARILEAEENYKEALQFIERANSGRVSYPLREAYLAGLCGDIERMSYCLEQLKREWDNLGAHNRMYLYGLLAMKEQKQGHHASALDYGISFLSYADRLGSATVELDFPEITNCVLQFDITKEDVEKRKSSLFGSHDELSATKAISFSLSSKPHIILPKILSSRPLCVAEMLHACKELSLDVPGYYEKHSFNPSEPARFLTGESAQKIARHLGYFLPEYDDIPDLQRLAQRYFRPNIQTVPSSADWDSAVEKLRDWGKFGSHQVDVIKDLLWTTCLTVEDKFAIMSYFKNEGVMLMPRAASYRIRGSRLNEEFAAKHPEYLLNQWRCVVSLLTLLELEKLPPITMAWGVKSLTKQSAVGEFLLLPLSTNETRPEHAHSNMSFADCVVVTAKLVDDSFVQHKGLFNE